MASKQQPSESINDKTQYSDQQNKKTATRINDIRWLWAS